MRIANDKSYRDRLNTFYTADTEDRNGKEGIGSISPDFKNTKKGNFWNTNGGCKGMTSGLYSPADLELFFEGKSFDAVFQMLRRIWNPG